MLLRLEDVQLIFSRPFFFFSTVLLLPTSSLMLAPFDQMSRKLSNREAGRIVSYPQTWDKDGSTRHFFEVHASTEARLQYQFAH